MKREIIFSLAMVAASVASHATILRVSNVSGSTAPYATIGAALKTAQNGDTIMVDGSAINYGNFKFTDSTAIYKPIVLLGPGYFLQENDMLHNQTASAEIGQLCIDAEGVIVQGMTINGNIEITAPKVIINRCYINGKISLNGSLAQNCILHQNFITGRITGDLDDRMNWITYNTQITNNIFTSWGSNYWKVIDLINNAVICNNTWTEKSPYKMIEVRNSTINNNILPVAENDSLDNANSRNNNKFLFESYSNLKSFEWDALMSPFLNQTNTDMEISDVEISKSGVGAFSGDDPYVISGIPSGPVIESLIIPASAQENGTMNITIKIGMSR